MSNLFQSMNINQMELKNRFVRSATMDPHMVRKLREVSIHESECISCNGCLVLSPGERINCVLL